MERLALSPIMQSIARHSQARRWTADKYSPLGVKCSLQEGITTSPLLAEAGEFKASPGSILAPGHPYKTQELHKRLRGFLMTIEQTQSFKATPVRQQTTTSKTMEGQVAVAKK